MKISVIQPSEALSEFVKCYWVLEKGDYLHVERLFPNGEVQFIFHYGTPFIEQINPFEESLQPRFLCCGQFTKHRDIISASGAGLFGVVFHPYALAAFMKMPASEAAHSTVDLSFIDKKYNLLGDRLLDAKDTQERIRITEDFLMRNISVPSNDHFKMMRESIGIISTCPSKFRMKDFIDRYFLSERQFERIFSRYVGIPPRSFSGIVRLNNAIKVIGNNESLTDVALASGYYDQSRFNHAFKSHTGYTPGEYRRILKSKMSV